MNISSKTGETRTCVGGISKVKIFSCWGRSEATSNDVFKDVP